MLITLTRKIDLQMERRLQLLDSTLHNLFIVLDLFMEDSLNTITNNGELSAQSPRNPVAQLLQTFDKGMNDRFW
jgi:hypothetical protein